MIIIHNGIIESLNEFNLNNNIKLLNKFIEYDKQYLETNKKYKTLFNIKALYRYINNFNTYTENIFDGSEYTSLLDYLNNNKYCKNLKI